MKSRILILSLLFISVAAQAQQLSPITKAVLNGYQAILNENPKDYNTLYQRATQYYTLSMYDEALVDIIKAIEYTPAKEKSMRVEEYSMLADIYTQDKDYEKALEAVNNAIALSDADYALLYKKGNICLYLDRPGEAYGAYSQMQRLKSRSQEAYFGMARADIKMGKTDEARELISQAEKADPNSYLTFCRIGELYEEMGEDENAAANYLSGFSLADAKSSRPLESLISLASRNYPAVEAALQYAISRTQNTASLYFLQASIAFNSGNFRQAYDGFAHLLESKEGQLGSVYATMARTCMALDKISEATTNADMAVIKDNNVNSQLVKAEVELAAGNPSASLLAATRASRMDPNNTKAQYYAALANIALKDYDAALELLNEEVMTDPTDIEGRLVRAYLNFEFLSNAQEANTEYTRIANSYDAENFKQICLKALAQYLSGKKLDADETVKRAIKDKENLTKDDYYYAAIYFSQSGDLIRGKEMIERAVALGYQNEYNLYKNNTANININPIRDLLPAKLN